VTALLHLCYILVTWQQNKNYVAILQKINLLNWFDCCFLIITRDFSHSLFSNKILGVRFWIARQGGWIQEVDFANDVNPVGAALAALTIASFRPINLVTVA